MSVVAITERAKTSDPAESRLTSAHDGAVEATVTGGVAVVPRRAAGRGGPG